MKKRLLTVSFLLIAVFLLMASAFAAGSINDLQTTASNVTASLNGTDKIDVTCTDLTAGDEYLIMVLEGSQIPDSSNIVYMDQKTANRSSLTFTVNPMRLDEGDYYIALSSTDSDLAIVGSFSVGTAASTPLKITKQPQSATVASGKTATVTVEAQGDGLTYQWYIKNVGQTKYSKSTTTTNLYRVKMSESSNGRRVYCVVTDKYGNKATSKTATLSMISIPVITKQPSDTEVYSGEYGTVTVEATGEELTYQWYIKNAGSSAFSKSGVTTNTYRVKMSANSDGRQVYCVITDKSGGVVTSNTATLSMLSLPVFTKQPQSVTVASGKTATVTVEATGEGLAYQWYIKNAGSSTFTKSSTTSDTYKVKMSDTNNGRQVYCIVTDKNGRTATSDTATLSMISIPVITKQPQSIAVTSGQTAAVIVEATGEGLTYQWYIKNASSSAFTKSSVTTNTYRVKMSANSDGRQAYCIVTDKSGGTVTSNTATLTMLSVPVITKQPQSVTVASGATATVTVEATGEGLTYQWYIKNAGSSAFSKSSTTSNTYKVKMSDANNGRQVYCVITDKSGGTVTSNTATLSMRSVPVIIKQPQSVAVASGQTATVTIEATGEGLTYQWYIKNSGSSAYSKSSNTTNTYRVKMSANSDGRQLYCVVTDQDGDSVKSDVVALHIG